MARRFLFASNETWAMAPDVMRVTTSAPVRHRSTFNPTLAVAVGVVIVVFFLVGFTTGVFKRYIVRPGETADLPENPRRRPNRSGTKTRDIGLDPEVVSALPLVKFAEFVQKGKSHVEDCAVCLAVYEESDILRLLPQCAHAFHTDCIDEWFKSHSTCPLCRHSLKTLEAKDVRADDQDHVEGDGATRRAEELDVVEVVIHGERNGAADASTGFSQEVATTEEAALQVNPSTPFLRTIRIGKSPRLKASIRRTRSVGTGLHLRPSVVDSEGTQHNLRVHAIALDHEQAQELSSGGASGSSALGVLLNFEEGARGLPHKLSTRWSFPNLKQMESS